MGKTPENTVTAVSLSGDTKEAVQYYFSVYFNNSPDARFLNEPDEPVRITFNTTHPGDIMEGYKSRPLISDVIKDIEKTVESAGGSVKREDGEIKRVFESVDGRVTTLGTEGKRTILTMTNADYYRTRQAIDSSLQVG